ncbi:MAG: hypothetical protein RJA22_858 [Verrucomicrobiota bacterium]|jgi:PAS domain S-box-containing protein
MELDAILNSLDDAVLTVDDRGRVVFLNETAARLFGCPRADALGRPVSEFPALAEAVAQLNLAEITPEPGRDHAARSLRLPPAGTPGPRLLGGRVSALHGEGHVFHTAILRDLTHQEQMEKAVYDARKMQAVGALAGGIAHDFNNILTAVISQIDLALHTPEFPENLRQNLIYAQTSARRGAELVGKLQAFSRQNKPSFGPVNLAEVLDQVVFMLRRSIDRRIEVRWTPPAPAAWHVRADATQLMQALLNLGLNARDAMPAGGTLTFTTRNLTLEGADLPAPRQPGEFVQVTVADTGHGMSPEALSRLFEPYFSTKDPSRGPGLALSITAAVIAEHGGWMEAESRAGQGAQFHLFLPRLREEQQAARPAPAPDPQLLEGRERILVAEDEELVRMVIKAILAYRGYDVLVAEDGQAAVEAFRDAQPRVQLVVTDIHMPRLNGYDALRQIRALDPAVPAVVLSGGVHDGADPLGGLPGVAFLHKPFENQELLRLVRQQLDRKSVN